MRRFTNAERAPVVRWSMLRPMYARALLRPVRTPCLRARARAS